MFFYQVTNNFLEMFLYGMRWKWVGAIAIKNCRLFGSLLYFATDKNMNNFFCPGCEAMTSIVALVHPDSAAYRGRPLVPHTFGDL